VIFALEDKPKAQSLPGKFSERESILGADFLYRFINARGHLQVIDIREYHTYQAKARAVQKERILEEQVAQWSRKMSILFPWIKRKRDAGNEKTPPSVDVARVGGESSKQSFAPLILTLTVSSV